MLNFRQPQLPIFFLSKNRTGYLLQSILSNTICSKEQGKKHTLTFLLYLYSSYIQNTHNAVNLEFHTFYNHWICKTLGKQKIKVEKSTVKLWEEFWSRHHVNSETHDIRSGTKHQSSKCNVNTVAKSSSAD